MAENICTIEGCDAPRKVHGYCRRCYARLWARAARHGNPPWEPRPPLAPVLDRLAEQSTQVGECIEWNGWRDDDGYGHIWTGKRSILTHRAAWIARHGQPPPETPCVLHHCDNPPCWRDEHLWVGTKADNCRDRARKGRTVGGHGRETHCPHGHPYSGTNLYVDPRNRRACRECVRRAQAKYHAKRRST
jgi:hypothetical protein